MNASAPSKGVVGTATATSGTVIGVEGGSAGSGGYGVYGNVSSSTGATVGVKGNSTSTSGTGVRGTNTATSGATTGVSGYVASAAGTAGAFNNAAGGVILSGQNNGVEKFTVDGCGNVNSARGTYRIGGSSVVNIGSPGDNLFLGVGAGSLMLRALEPNVFSGYTLATSTPPVPITPSPGFQARLSNTTGTDNTFYGNEAGISNTTALQCLLGLPGRLQQHCVLQHLLRIFRWPCQQRHLQCLLRLRGWPGQHRWRERRLLRSFCRL